MTGFLDTLDEAGGRSADTVGSALGSITDGLNCAVGGAADKAELPVEVRDDLEKFKNIDPGLLTGGTSELSRIVADPAGFPDPSEFFAGLDPNVTPEHSNFSEFLNDPNFPLDSMLASAGKKLDQGEALFHRSTHQEGSLFASEQEFESNTDSINEISASAARLDPVSAEHAKHVSHFQFKLQQVDQLRSTLHEVVNNLNTVKQSSSRKPGG